MKKILLLLMAGNIALDASAQTATSQNYKNQPSRRWTLDINAMGGGAMQDFTTINSAPNYANVLNMNTGELKYNNGYAIGGNAQLGFFFGKKRHFGLGAGITYMQQYGDAVLRDFHTEFKSTDGSNQIFRQIVTGNSVKERLTSTNISLPLVIKYKTRFSKRWGFMADAGALVNLQMNNSYKSNSTFNYEAIYKFVTSESGAGLTAVYDNAANPAISDWMITRAQFLRNNPNGDVAAYFNEKRALGYRVGEGVNPGSRSGSSAYTAGSVGFVIQPSINYYLSDNVALNLGAYYMFQPFKNDAQVNYRLTTGMTDYNSVTNSVSESKNHNYGMNLGVRFFIGRNDRDHDGTSDKKDKCPDVYGLRRFNGCPDTDGDSISDDKDSCALVFGLAKFNGCPDTDGDGIPDKTDECPLIAGPAILHGCPDRDGDGIADKDDRCPDVAGLVQYQGCPDRDGDGLPDRDDDCPDVPGPLSNRGCPIDTVKEEAIRETPKSKSDISTPILFEVNETTIQAVSYPQIERAATELKENKNMRVMIDGHADESGPESFNRVLSIQRANSVKTQLVNRGVNSKKIKTAGHGSTQPTATNETYEGKEKNRRAVMTVVPGTK